MIQVIFIADCPILACTTILLGLVLIQTVLEGVKISKVEISNFYRILIKSLLRKDRISHFKMTSQGRGKGTKGWLGQDQGVVRLGQVRLGQVPAIQPASRKNLSFSHSILFALYFLIRGYIIRDFHILPEDSV